MKENAIVRPTAIGPESEIFRIRATVIGERDSRAGRVGKEERRGGYERCAGARRWGSPPPQFAGGLFRGGRAVGILSRNGVDVTTSRSSGFNGGKIRCGKRVRLL